MIKRSIILGCFLGLSVMVNAASVVNLDLISVDQEQAKPDARNQMPEKSGYQTEIRNLPIVKKNHPLSFRQNHSYLERILNANRTDGGFFFNRAGLGNARHFEEETQDNPGENKIVWDEIKTSIKEINSEWNRIESWINHFFVDDDNMPNLAEMSSEHIDLLTDANRASKFADDPTANLYQTDALNDLVYSEQVLAEDQTLLNQILFFFSLPRLLKFLSDNLVSLIIIFCLWLSIKGLIKFMRWKSRKKRKIRKNRTIDGVIKY